MQPRRFLLHNITINTSLEISTSAVNSSSPDSSLIPISTASTTHSFDPSFVAITAIICFAFLFFFGFFSLYAHRIFAGLQGNPPMPSPVCASGTRGLDPELVKALPVLPYPGTSSAPLECVVCLGEFEDGESVKVIPRCGHLFHPKCIDVWLVSRGSCPICRSTKMLAPTTEEDVVIEVEVVTEGGMCSKGESSDSTDVH